MKAFSPTALLIMTHNVTGLKYFCKTTRLDRLRTYKGSGVAWKKHITEYGKDIKVEILGIYYDEYMCIYTAKQFSKDNDIVKSDTWANLVEETGKNGASLNGERNPFYGKKHSKESLSKMKMFQKGVSVNAGIPKSKEHREKLSAALKGIPNPIISEKLTGKTLSEETRKKYLNQIKVE